MQTTFSIDYRGPTTTNLSEGDILTPATASGMPGYPAPGSPLLFLSGGSLGLQLPAYASCTGHPPGDQACVEVDALSYGADVEPFEGGDPRSPDAQGTVHHRLWFSVDEFAVGLSDQFHCAPTYSPSVTSEGNTLATGANEASADLFMELRLPSAPVYPPAPLCPLCPPTACPGPSSCFAGNGGAADGNGMFSSNFVRYPGLGLVEPNPSSSCTPGVACPAAGDDVDALDVDGPLLQPGELLQYVYFSLDSSFSDPLLGVPNSGSAQANTVLPFFAPDPGDVLVADLSAGGLTVYAQSTQLGLDLVGPMPMLGSDDLDALIYNDNTPCPVGGPPCDPDDPNHLFEASRRPYDWNLSGPQRRDLLLFSVRRGSRVIGRLDSLLGLPIEPGDILTTPFAPVAGAWTNPANGCTYSNPQQSPYPAIFIPAEMLGLRTDRMDGILGNEVGDDIDALDTSALFFDCNGMGFGVEDLFDLVDGTSPDGNFDGVPDECELGSSSPYCTAGTTTSGCLPSIAGIGTPSATSASGFSLSVANVEGLKTGLLFYGCAGPLASPWGSSSSLLCVKAPTQRMTPMSSGGTLNMCDGVLAQDWNTYMATNPSALCNPLPPMGGTCVWVQGWFRDPPSPKTTNLSDALSFVVGP